MSVRNILRLLFANLLRIINNLIDSLKNGYCNQAKTSVGIKQNRLNSSYEIVGQRRFNHSYFYNMHA